MPIPEWLTFEATIPAQHGSGVVAADGPGGRRLYVVVKHDDTGVHVLSVHASKAEATMEWFLVLFADDLAAATVHLDGPRPEEDFAAWLARVTGKPVTKETAITVATDVVQAYRALRDTPTDGTTTH